MIKLYFKEFHDLDLIAKGAKSHIIRLFADMRFRMQDGWTKPYPAILDTGAHTTLIPFRIWNRCPVSITADHVVRGVVPRKECSMPILIGDISCALVDREQQSDELTISAYLALTDDIPLVIGFWDLLERFQLHMNYSIKEAYLEE